MANPPVWILTCAGTFCSSPAIGLVGLIALKKRPSSAGRSASTMKWLRVRVKTTDT